MSHRGFQTEERKLGAKKMAIVCNDIVENIREHELSKCLSVGDIDHIHVLMCNFVMSGGNLNIRDGRTKESFLHVLADYAHLYLSAASSRIFYFLCIKIDMDYTDENGDTALHKVVRVPGAWRAIVAMMRCGASPLIKNKAGRTPEDEILFSKTIGYEENLHWLRKFLPGLWAAVMSRQPDPVLVERLLRYWCRTSKMEGKEPRNLKCVMANAPLDFVCIVENYENTNEMALAMLCGKSFMINHWKKAKESMSGVDINTKDHSYQFHYREYPNAPRPLLAAIWEMEDFDLIKAFMQLNPDTAIKYTFESEASSPPKPLFFQLVNPKSRPHNEAITAHILAAADLNLRTREGRTILMEALHNGETEGIVRTILNSGVNLAARDGLGRTARDYADILKRADYRQLIDSRVTELIHAGDAATIGALVLQQYPYVTHNLSRMQIMNLLRHPGNKHLVEVLKGSSSSKALVQKLFNHVKAGNKAAFVKLMIRSMGPCRDKAGRTLLHVAIQFSHRGHASHTSQPSPAEDDLNTVDSHVLYNNSQNSQQGRDKTLRRDVSNNSSNNGSSQDDETSFNDVSTLTGSRIILMDNMDIQEPGQEQKMHRIGKKYQSTLCKLMKKKTSWRFCQCHNFTPDHEGIVEYLLAEYPYMLDMQNTFGQTPLHYAYIYTAPQMILGILRGAGSKEDIKDVFDFLPKDYSKQLCGDQTFKVRRKATVELDLEIFLEETNFKVNFYKAIVNGNADAVKKLALPLLELGGSHKFHSVLFDCLDMGQFDIAWSLVDAGFPWDISKQYESCSPDDPMCAMMECSHAVTTLRQRAQDTGALEVASLIDKLQQETQVTQNSISVS